MGSSSSNNNEGMEEGMMDAVYLSCMYDNNDSNNNNSSRSRSRRTRRII
jgi:hypothetical protein